MTDRSVSEDSAAPPRRRVSIVGQLAIAVTVALLGFLLALQLRVQEGLAERLAVEREEDLGQILSELTARNDELFDQILELQLQLAKTADSEQRDRTLVSAARDDLQALQILLGIIPVKGSGVQIEIGDPETTVGPEVILDVIQELRDAGAEAIEIGSIRVVASTAVGGRPGELVIGGLTVGRPYQLRAVGDARTLAEAMRIPGGVVDTISSRPGASIRVTERRSVSILSTARLPTFRYARPLPRR